MANNQEQALKVRLNPIEEKDSVLYLSGVQSIDSER